MVELLLVELVVVSIIGLVVLLKKLLLMIELGHKKK
jgi:hypothetical protein